MTTHINTVAASGRPIGEAHRAVLYLDPDVEALFAEVDAILCAALRPHRCLPAPPATGSALTGPRSTGRSPDALLRRRWRAPVHPVHAVPRSPPEPRTTRDDVTNPQVKGR